MHWLLLAASYLIGSIPTSYLVGQVSRGIDLRERGSGNLGATNAFRVLGWPLALPVLGFDLLKGWFPAYLFPSWDAAGPGWALVYGVAAVAGHVFPIYMHFRGGKGVATSAGVLLAVAPVPTVLAVGVWATVVLISRIVSLASLAAAVVLPVAVYAVHDGGIVFWLSVGLASLVIVMHRSNIVRLLRGEEQRIGRRARERC